MNDKSTNTSFEITFVDYYLRTYQRQIKDLRQPLMVCIEKCASDQQRSRPSYKPKYFRLIPEFCLLTGK